MVRSQFMLPAAAVIIIISTQMIGWLSLSGRVWANLCFLQYFAISMYYFCDWFKAGFLNLSTTDTLGWIVLWGGGYPRNRSCSGLITEAHTEKLETVSYIKCFSTTHKTVKSSEITDHLSKGSQCSLENQMMTDILRDALMCYQGTASAGRKGEAEDQGGERHNFPGAWFVHLT